MKLIYMFILTASLSFAAIINCPTCSQDDFEHAYYEQSQPGDTIVLPAGSATWGNSSRPNAGITYIITNVTVVGQGDNTVITLDNTGSTYAGGVIACWAAATFKHFKIVGSNVNPVTAFNISSYSGFTNGFRISDITYIGGTSDAYFAFIASGITGGLFDNCRITGNSPSAELIVGRGPSNAWQAVNTVGTANNIFIEDCTFNNTGYVCDANANAQFVVRFCTINGVNKIDAHGMASNSPSRSFRNIEAYHNTFTAGGGGTWQDIEIRGGTGMVFNNSASVGWFILTDYGYQAEWPNYNNLFQTPYNYPLGDQVGAGTDITFNATAITAGQSVRIKTVGSTDYTLIGSPSNTVGTFFDATGPGIGSGTVTTSPATEPMYVFGNTLGSSPWPRTMWAVANISITTDSAGYSIGSTNIGIESLSTDFYVGNYLSFAGDNTRYVLDQTKYRTSLNLNNLSPSLQVAILPTPTAASIGAYTNYQKQISNPTIIFAEADIIQSNRDFYSDAGFDTNTGVSIGTTTQMNALTPSVTGYGFWVTDQGSWRSGYSGTSGLLYRWSGSAWVLYYTPYTYPHPLQGGQPITTPTANITTLHVGWVRFPRWARREEEDELMAA